MSENRGQGSGVRVQFVEACGTALNDRGHCMKQTMRIRKDPENWRQPLLTPDPRSLTPVLIRIGDVHNPTRYAL